MFSAVSSLYTSLIDRFGGSQCSNEEQLKANEVKQIHDRIEEVAYRAFAQKVIELNITQDDITEEQSGQILCHIKSQAHREMYKVGGYIDERGKLLNPTQVQEVLRNVGKIVHDRDTKLTDARYYTLSELLMGLDDHNTMVKEILLRSWYKCPKVSDAEHSHLEQIKEKVDFYVTLNGHLKFDFKQALKERKAFWDRYFPGKREASETSSQEFVNILEVRHYFESTDNIKRKINVLKEANPDEKLEKLLTPEERLDLFEPRCKNNLVRRRSVNTLPLLQDQNMTVGEFFTKYFPEIELHVNKKKRIEPKPGFIYKDA